MVLCVSTMHKVGNRVKRMRKQPRKTVKNKNNIGKIWGEKGATNIYMPSLIDDYNYWMGSVDVADQRISYYHPSKLVCRRIWIPILAIALYHKKQCLSGTLYKLQKSCHSKTVPSSHDVLAYDNEPSH